MWTVKVIRNSLIIWSNTCPRICRNVHNVELGLLVQTRVIGSATDIRSPSTKFCADDLKWRIEATLNVERPHRSTTVRHVSSGAVQVEGCILKREVSSFEDASPETLARSVYEHARTWPRWLITETIINSLIIFFITSSSADRRVRCIWFNGFIPEASQCLIDSYHAVVLGLTLWRPLLPYGYSYRAACAKPG